MRLYPRQDQILEMRAEVLAAMALVDLNPSGLGGEIRLQTGDGRGRVPDREGRRDGSVLVAGNCYGAMAGHAATPTGNAGRFRVKFATIANTPTGATQRLPCCRQSRA